MRVAIIGGTGAFGLRMVDLLCRDGHEVVVVGRSLAPLKAAAAQFGTRYCQLDRAGDLAGLWAVSPEVVVDAAGPYHSYGDDPYALPRACIARGVHYLDLADTPEFCVGIGVLDAAAKAAGVCVMSGMSSVPALSSAVVAALAADDPIDTIDTAILPGNRAPRGRSVVQSILDAAGKGFGTVIDGQSDAIRGWSRPAAYDLGEGISRKGWMLAVPDQALFPKHFAARSVIFRAGLELGVMNWGLAVFSMLRGRRAFRVPVWFGDLVRQAARVLWPFGTDLGGMSVAVTVRAEAGWQTRRWRLIARAGDGPFVPTLAVRAILRAPHLLRAGARPAVAVVPLADFETALADLAITTRRDERPVVPLFRRILGTRFDALPLAVQNGHDVAGPRVWKGQSQITRGRGLWERLIAAVMRFPAAGVAVPVTVTMWPQDGGEVWRRVFAQRSFKSVMRDSKAGLTERFGPFTFLLDLTVRDSALHFAVRRGWCLGIAMPQVCLPQSIAIEREVDGRYAFDVSLLAPFTGGLIVRYRGQLQRDLSPPARPHQTG